MGGTPLGKLSPHARVRYKNVPCENTRRLYLTGLSVPGTYQVSVHGNCRCNELVALYNRHLVDRTGIPFSPAAWGDAVRRVRKLIQFPHSVEPMSLMDVTRSYSGRKRRIYYRAMLDVQQQHWDDQWARVKMFVKPDKYPVAEIDSKEPRAIQYRDPRFNIQVATWLKPFEEQFYRTEHRGLRVVAKGLTPSERAAVLKEAWDNCANPVALLVDHSRFDSCVRVEHLKSVHKIYWEATRSKHLRWLMRHQLRNQGVSQTGIKYTIKGSRMSGDYDTALGNTIINCVVLLSIFGEKAYVLIDGDDSVVIMERKDLPPIQKVQKRCENLGFQATVVEVRDFAEIEFCRSKVLDSGSPRMARDWCRAMSNFAVTTKYYPASAMRRYLKGMALGEWALNPGVPIIQPICAGLAEMPGRPIIDDDSSWKLHQGEAPQLITAEDETTYGEAWAVSLQTILKLQSLPVSALVKTPDVVDYWEFLARPDASQAQ